MARMARNFARCDCKPHALHRIVDKRHPGYWITMLVQGVCQKRSKLEGLVLWNHLDMDYPEDEEDGAAAEKLIAPN